MLLVLPTHFRERDIGKYNERKNIIYKLTKKFQCGKILTTNFRVLVSY